ncbi:hypothetical protein ACIRPU_20905 [Streptomyces sp. NPDC102259]|uniref:hypothetical protein n=1 Tax=Streptomyces sp. NPDC102259 TaxID=3366148 RepID=UPI003827DFC2
MALLYTTATDPTAVAAATATEVAAPDRQVIELQVIAILPRESALDALPVAAYRDAAGEFARLYRPNGPTAFVIRPDGYLGTRFPLPDTAAALPAYLTALSPRMSQRRPAGEALAE